jgi:hypothetical protein
MAGTAQIRAKEARVQLTVDGVRLGGTFSTIHDVSMKPDVTLDKKRFTGMPRATGDMDIKGWDLSFKTEKSDHTWKFLWKQIADAELNGRPFPDIVMVVTYRYRDGSPVLLTETFSGDMVLKMDENSIPQNGYQMNSWTGFCSYDTDTQS